MCEQCGFTFKIVENVEPDHPWNDENQVDGYCLDRGQTWVGHDGNASKVLDWMARVWP